MLLETLWEKIAFWKKPKMLEENVDYSFVNFEDTDLTGIVLLKEPFDGVVYHYGRARVVEQGELAKLEFGYTIVSPGKHDPDELQKNEEFHTMMGDILTLILQERAPQDESVRTDDFEESDLQ